MKKNVFGRKFKRDINERKALFKGLMSALVLEERIKTTEEKAKAIRGQIEKLVTKVKKNNSGVTGFLGQYLTPIAMQKMVVDIAPRFTSRNGGYTRILHVGNRFYDNASMVIMEWVEGSQNAEVRAQNSELNKKEEKKEKENKKSTTTKVKSKIVTRNPKTSKRKEK